MVYTEQHICVCCLLVFVILWTATRLTYSTICYPCEFTRRQRWNLFGCRARFCGQYPTKYQTNCIFGNVCSLELIIWRSIIQFNYCCVVDIYMTTVFLVNALKYLSFTQTQVIVIMWLCLFNNTPVNYNELMMNSKSLDNKITNASGQWL